MQESQLVVARVLEGALDRVVGMNRHPAEAWVRRIRSSRPELTPSDVIRQLETEYRRRAMTVGAVGGAAAAVPGLTTGLGLATAPVEIAGFLELTAVFAHAVADVHGVHVDDPESKRLLILAVTLGGPGAEIVERLAGRTGAHWGRLLVRRLPRETLRQVNKALGRTFLTRYGTKQGALVLGRAAPFFVGSAIGAAGNAVLAQGSIAAARNAFGPPPPLFPYRGPTDDVIDGEVVEP